MLNIAKPKDIALIRDNFSTNPLFITLQDACSACCEIPRTYDLRPEQIFVDVIHLLDECKRLNANVEWNNLYRQIRQDYHLLNKDISNDDLCIIASTILTTLGTILTAHFAYYQNLTYWTIAQSLLIQPADDQPTIPQQAKNELNQGIVRHNQDLTTWLNNYLQSSDYISTQINDLYNNLDPLAFNRPKHIVIVPEASPQQREEFQSIMLRLCNAPKGKKGVAAKVKNYLIKAHRDGIIRLIGPIDAIYDDLVTFYGYQQSRSGFYDAPDLTKFLD